MLRQGGGYKGKRSGHVIPARRPIGELPDPEPEKREVATQAGWSPPYTRVLPELPDLPEITISLRQPHRPPTPEPALTPEQQQPEDGAEAEEGDRPETQAREQVLGQMKEDPSARAEDEVALQDQSRRRTAELIRQLGPRGRGVPPPHYPHSGKGRLGERRRGEQLKVDREDVAGALPSLVDLTARSPSPPKIPKPTPRTTHPLPSLVAIGPPPKKPHSPIRAPSPPPKPASATAEATRPAIPALMSLQVRLPKSTELPSKGGKRQPAELKPPAREVGERTPGCWNCGQGGHSWNKCREPLMKFCRGCGKGGYTEATCSKCRDGWRKARGK